jgi:hypothetical protein
MVVSVAISQRWSYPALNPDPGKQGDRTGDGLLTFCGAERPR